MNKQQAERIRSAHAFVAALDQSGGSTPKALAAYGIAADRYNDDETMFDLVHQMRTRIIKSPAFNSDKILAAILFEQTMDRKIDGKLTADFLWEDKGIVPFLKVDQGMLPEEDGVTLMKEIKGMDELLARAVERHIFGTKMRSVIHAANPEGIRKIVDQQVEFGLKIHEAGLIPILEPEVDINIPDKAEAEAILKDQLLAALNKLDNSVDFMLKLSIPTVDNFYSELIEHPRIMRVVALSGGYDRDKANELLAKNHGLIASFSRALVEGLSDAQSDEEFNAGLGSAIDAIAAASAT